MSFSQEVRFKIGGDMTLLERSFAKAPAIAEAAGRKMEQAFNRGRKSVGGDSLSRAQGAALDREYAAAVRRTKAERDLSDFRKRNAYAEADTVGRIKIVTGDLARLSKDRAKFEDGSVQALRLQLQMEEKMASLRELRQTRANELQSANQGLIGSPGAFTGREVLRGVGGVIAAVLGSLVGNQQMKIRMAEAQEQSTGMQASSLRARFAQIGGLAGQLRQGEGSEKDLKNLLSYEQNRLEDMTGGKESLLRRNPGATGGQIAAANIRQAISNLTPEGQKIASDQFEKVQQTQAQLTVQQNQNAVTQRELQRQQALFAAQLGRSLISRRGSGVSSSGARDIGLVGVGPETGSVPSLEAALKSSSMSALKLAEIEQRRLAKEVEAERQFGTPEARQAAEIARRTQATQVESIRRDTQQRLIDVRTDLTQKVAAGAGVDETGRPRGKSELERLADRAANRRALAQEIVVTNPRGEHFGPNGEGRGGSSWDDRWGAELAARDKRMTAIYIPGRGVVSAAQLEKESKPRFGSVGTAITQARRDEAEVSGRLSAATANQPGVATADSASIRSELINANQLLGAIVRALNEEAK